MQVVDIAHQFRLYLVFFQGRRASAQGSRDKRFEERQRVERVMQCGTGTGTDRSGMDQTIGIEVGFQRLFNRRHRRCGYRFAASRLGCALWLGGSGLGRPAALLAHRRSLALIAVMMCRSEEHTSELQSLMLFSYAVFCLTNKYLY